MKSSNCIALLGDVISFECRQEVYPTILGKNKATEKVKSKAKKIGLSPKEVLIYTYVIRGVLCDSVNCVIEKSTKLVK